jgi:TonB-dependent SusC/RagA subfamily outer membrane receptor
MERRARRHLSFAAGRGSYFGHYLRLTCLRMNFPILPLATGFLVLAAGFSAAAQSVPGIPMRMVPVLPLLDSPATRLQSTPGVPIQPAQVPQPRDSAKPIRLACRLNVISNQPLFVIDGRLVATGAPSNLNPQDIEQVLVLKEPAATALYGSRGQYGAILITTKHKPAAKPYPQRPLEAGVTAP